MTIGFDGSRAFTSAKTGTENYSYQLLVNLSKIDHQNTYIVYLRPPEIKITGWPNNFRFKLINFKRLWTQAGLASQTFIDNLDVLFIPSHTLPIIRKPGLKTVVTVHDLGSEYLPSMHQVKQRLYLSLMQRHQLRGVSKIIAVSQATKKDLVDRIGIDSGKVEVVYEGYDRKLFKPVSARGRSSFGRNGLRQYRLKSGQYFLFVGTIQPRKNIERIIIAFRNQPDDLKLVIAGQKGWLSDEIYKLPKKLGIEDSVKFLGYVPNKDLPALYSGAIALTLPSLFEGFGLPILEAQACGCPVITSNLSSMPEVAGKGAILVDPYNVDDIVKGMERLQRAPEGEGYREQVIKRGFENIRGFSWEKCARETLQVLETLST